MRQHAPASDLVEVSEAVVPCHAVGGFGCLRALRHVEADVSVEASNGDDVRTVTRLDVYDGEFVLESDDLLLIPVRPFAKNSCRYWE